MRNPGDGFALCSSRTSTDGGRATSRRGRRFFPDGGDERRRSNTSCGRLLVLHVRAPRGRLTETVAGAKGSPSSYATGTRRLATEHFAELSNEDVERRGSNGASEGGCGRG